MSLTDPSTAGTPTSPLVQELLQRIADRVPADRVEVVQAFAKAYVRRLPTTGTGLTAEELFGQVIGLFELADGRTGDVAVRALNPTLAGDGYTSVGTVVETNTEDSPFLVDSVTNELAAQGHDRARRDPPRDRHGARRRRPADARPARPRGRGARERHALRDRQQAPDAELAAVADGVRVGARRRAARGARPRRDEGAAGAHDRGGAGPPRARYEADEIDETVAFLRWLGQGNFIFLGYREYAIVDEGAGPRPERRGGLRAWASCATRAARPTPGRCRSRRWTRG